MEDGIMRMLIIGHKKQSTEVASRITSKVETI